MEEYDFITVGSGSGLDVANVAANQGLSVAVIEKDALGGTCLNRGCIPSKMLLYHADIKRTIEQSEDFHINATVDDVEFSRIVEEVNEDVGADASSIQRGLRSADAIDLFEGTAEFVDEHTLTMVTGDRAGTKIHGKRILVAAGSRPSVPDIDGIADVDYLTSREALQLETPPDRLVIIGGGYIAAELGHFFGTFGSDIRIIGRRNHLLPHADREVGEAFTDRYADRFDVHVGYEATAVEETDTGTAVHARPYPPATETTEQDSVTVEGDAVLVAAGRQPNSDLLAVEQAGIETDEQGFIDVDEYLQTSVDGIWALGDIVGEYLLKHNANHEAQTVVQNVFGEEVTPIDYTAMPFAVFATPEVAGVGITEQELDPDQDEYATRTYQYADTARGDAMNAEGFVKVIIDLDGTILGCHIIGPDASTLIQEVVTAMKAGSGTVHDIRESVHIHPALPEVVQRAFSGRFVPAGHDHSHDHHHHHE